MPTGGTSDKQSGKGVASLPLRLFLLFVAAFAIVHLPLGTSEPLRPSQYQSGWPKDKIRSADLPVHYSVQEQGRGQLAATADIRLVQKTTAPDAPPKALAASETFIASYPRNPASGPTDTRRGLENARTAAFSARAPPALA